jgi:hypothetical protein
MVPRRFDQPVQTTMAQQFASELRHKESKYVSFWFRKGEGTGLMVSRILPLAKGLRLRTFRESSVARVGGIG